MFGQFYYLFGFISLYETCGPETTMQKRLTQLTVEHEYTLVQPPRM